MKKKDAQRVYLLANQMAKIDNAMEEIKKVTGTRHTIKFHNEEAFMTLVKLEEFFESNRVMRGRSWSFYLMNCTINFKRNPKTK